MAFRKVTLLIPSCDGCGLAWSFGDLACAEGIPPHFASRAAGVQQLSADYGWHVQQRKLGRPLMACRRCAAAGILPDSADKAWLMVLTGWLRRVVPFGPVRRPLPPGPVPGHPESLTAKLPQGDEELLAAIEDENFPRP
jgi:hypothetical protein